MFARPLIVAALVLAACGSDDSADSDDPAGLAPVPTVSGVGELPESVPDTASVTTSTEPPIDVDVAPLIDEELAGLDGLVAERVDGNRLLVIGDSIMASTATRYGREMCDALNPLGWDVEVDAEPGRFVDFGPRVLDRVLPDEPDPDSDSDSATDSEDDWDAAIVHLGSNYRGDQNAYFEDLTEMLSRLEPRPTLLYTVTEYRPSWSEANAVIRELAEVFENVTLIDWEQAARTPGVLSADGLHPTNAGEEVLVGLAAAALGTIDGDTEGECLRSSFTDDSAIRQGGGTPNGSSSSTGGSSSSSSSSGGSTSSSTGGSSNTSTTLDTSNPTTTSSPDSTTGGSTTGGSTTGGSTDGFNPTTTLPGSTTGGTTGGSTTGGSTDGGTTGGSTTGGSTDGGTTGGTTDGTTGGTATTSPPPASTSPPPVITSPPPASTSPPPASTSPPPPPPDSTTPPPGP